METIKFQDIEILIEEPKMRSVEVAGALTEEPSVKKYFENSRFRVLSAKTTSSHEPETMMANNKAIPSVSKEVVVYDYTRNCCVFLRTGKGGDETVEIIETNVQPIPDDGEFDDAVELVFKRYENLHQAYKEKSIRIYKPMPPTIDNPFPNGRIERTLTVGIHSKTPGIISQILGVNMISGRIIRYKQGAPRFSLGGDDHCGIQDARQKTTSRGTPGEAWITIKDGGKETWKFLVVRPAASSGTLGSGVELKYVNYKGKRVLHQAHVPILNVQYDDNKCGPFRDWQFQESMFEANGNDVVQGIRICNSKARTILDSNSDKGNFRGVAIYVDNGEVVLVSGVEARWYRYISEWRFHSDGTILPRFGFAAVQNECVCNIHHHHVYWRLNFDIETSENNLVEEFNDPVLVGDANWHKILFEIRRLKDPSRNRKWRVSNTNSGSVYEVIPGANDGLADNFGVGDLWVIRSMGEYEIDDGIYAVRGSLEKCKAHIDYFMNGDSVHNEDIVIWYGAHFTHDIQADVGHVVGPTLKCVKW